jgi:hypothetical protein
MWLAHSIPVGRTSEALGAEKNDKHETIKTLPQIYPAIVANVGDGELTTLTTC